MNLALAHRVLLAKQNYVRKADPHVNYWFDFSAVILKKYIENNGINFKLIIIGSANLEADFYAIPYAALQDILTDNNLSDDKGGKRRWVGNIFGHTLKLRNCPVPKDIGLFYGNPILLSDETSIPLPSKKLTEDEENDYSIENRRLEINVRQKQSVFRKNVLKNFQRRCCISALTETNLLRASHIVPWSHRVDSRLDPSNGLCLSVAYDHLFDQGFIGFTESLKVIITPQHKRFSAPLQSILKDIDAKQASLPKLRPINTEYLCYHREKILIKA
jgi:putative restriction endonuclease